MRTSREWRAYYEQNARSLVDIPWDAGAELTQVERVAITTSVQGFQAGESSEGRHLYRAAAQYGDESNDQEYIRAIGLFIGEEQRHARDLARFLKLNDIPTLTTTAPDRVFRWLRHLVGSLENSIAVLITAEIIARVYYAALKAATKSTILDTLCAQILRDEEKHVEFQAEQLGRLRARRGPMLYAATVGLQRCLFWGTCLVVWLFHRKAFRRGGYGFDRFWRDCWTAFSDAFTHSAATRAHIQSGGGSSTEIQPPTEALPADRPSAGGPTPGR